MRYLSDGSRYYGPSWLGEAYDAITNTKSWLYGEWTKEKLNTYRILNRGPFGDYMDYLLDSRSDSEYLYNTGLDYSNIHDPRKLSATASASRMISSASMMFSRNIHKLYS